MMADAGLRVAVTGARHIAVIAAPTSGHLNPLQVLGAELVARGHRVTVVHVDGTGALLTDTGIGFAPIAHAVAAPGSLQSYLKTLGRPTGPVGLTRMIRATAAMTTALLEGAPAVLERIGADAVIADSVEPAGALVARRVGIPYAISVTGLPLLREKDVPPPFLGWRYRPDAMGRVRNHGGYAVSDWLMRPIDRVLDEYRRGWGLAERAAEPVLHVAQCPRSLDYPRTALPPRFAYGSPWRHAEAEEAPLAVDDRPLVFCSLGTLQGGRRDLFATITRACAAIGARAVVGHGGGLTAAEAAALPGDPLVRAFWPQAAVMRQCAAAVLHGGFNSVLDALAAGVPIVALPIAFEQPATAARLARIGAGRVLSPRRLGTGALAAALRTVMSDPSYRDSARRIAAEMREAGGAPRAAAAISAALLSSP